MVFIPGKKLLDELQINKAGIWFITPDNTNNGAIVFKAPTTSLKAVYRGTSLFILLASVRFKKKTINFAGYKIDVDDPVHPYFAIHHLYNDGLNQIKSVESILSEHPVRIHFFDEQNSPVFSAKCTLLNPDMDIALGISLSAKLSGKHNLKEQNAARNLLQQDLESMNNGKEPVKSLILFISTSLSMIELNTIASISSVVTENYQLDDSDEGGALEKSVYRAMAGVFKEQTFHSPSVGEKSSDRELTDVLGFGGQQICLVESKALSLLNTSLDRKHTRKASLIEKDITKGIRQLKGAIRKLKLENGVFYIDGKKIVIPDIEVASFFGIVLISEMNPFLDWQKIAKILTDNSNPRENLVLCVIDLSDFNRLSLIAQTPQSFSRLMLNRFMMMLSNQTAYISEKISPYE